MKRIGLFVLTALLFSACKTDSKQPSNDSSTTEGTEIVNNTDEVKAVEATDNEEETVVSLGDWEEKFYKDEFGENTNVKLASQRVKGVFSQSDTDDSPDMTADIIVDADEVLFRLKRISTYEYNEDNIVFKIKDDNNNISEFNMRANKSGYIRPDTEEEEIALRNLLFKGGVLKVIGTVKHNWGDTYYKFTFNADGLENALSSTE